MAIPAGEHRLLTSPAPAAAPLSLAPTNPSTLQQKYYLGLDVGTTATKACAFSPDGEFLGVCEKGYQLRHPAPGAAVQSPMDVLHAAEDALTGLIEKMGRPPEAIGLSCPMHSLLLFDFEYEAILTDVITWADTRAQAVMGDFTPEQCAAFHRVTGTPVHPMSPLVKLRWMLREQPELRETAGYCYDLKSFLTRYWTNTAVLDEQLASATGLYDAAAGEWYQPALKMAADGKFPFILPPVKPADHQLEWDESIATRLGVTGVPLFLGGSDGVLANFGSGILEPGEFALSVGTSAAVRTTHDRAKISSASGLFNYKFYGDRYVIGGASNNGGKVLEYWQNLLRADFGDVAAFIDGAMSVDAGDAPEFRPWLYGERAPVWDASATAELTGLRGHHSPNHLAAAVLHGVTDNIVTMIRQLEKAVGPAERIQVTGGITKSPEWLQLLEKKSGRAVVKTSRERATGYGAALVAMGKLKELR